MRRSSRWRRSSSERSRTRLSSRTVSSPSAVLRVDDSGFRDIPGARVSRKKDWLGVVADRDEDAVRAMRALEAT